MARESFEGSDWGERGQPVSDAEPAPRRLWPKPLTAAGAVAVLAAAVVASGLSLGIETGELETRGEAVAAPLERLHQAQREKIRQAMNAPFVLGVSRARLERIADCESHGDPRAVGGGGLYRGKYQFHRGTWASVGGVGDPARASELEQDRRAAMLIKGSGSNPWPSCS